MRRTKIVATIGPSCDSSKIITQMIHAGMNVARLNMSHSSNPDSLKKLVSVIRESANKCQKKVGILMDLSGPKIRVDSDINSSIIKIKKGDHYTIGDHNSDIPLNIDISFKDIHSEAEVKIDDGKLIFSVLQKKNNTLELIAESDGEILPSKGVNFPGIDLNIPSVTEKDIQDAIVGVELNVDWIAMSFVRQAEDRKQLDKIISKSNKVIPLIAKIEKPEAMQNLSAIIDAYDGILIARGDLGVEMPLEQVPILQKKILAECNIKGKPVITATQMMESMIENPTPTRAEVGDVAGAIYDGTDAVMLSGETAMGQFPVETIISMSKIANNVEAEISKTDHFQRNEPKFKKATVLTSICHSAYDISGDINIPIIVVMTESGNTAKMVSNYRPDADIIALCPHSDICNELSLYWGIRSFLSSQLDSTESMLDYAQSLLRENGLIRRKQKFVFMAGVPVGVSGSTNLLKVHTVI